jgi:hypothetical protein
VSLRPENAKFRKFYVVTYEYADLPAVRVERFHNVAALHTPHARLIGRDMEFFILLARTVTTTKKSAPEDAVEVVISLIFITESALSVYTAYTLFAVLALLTVVTRVPLSRRLWSKRIINKVLRSPLQ